MQRNRANLTGLRDSLVRLSDQNSDNALLTFELLSLKVLVELLLEDSTSVSKTIQQLGALCATISGAGACEEWADEEVNRISQLGYAELAKIYRQVVACLRRIVCLRQFLSC